MLLTITGIGTLAAALIADHRGQRPKDDVPPGCPCRGEASSFGAMNGDSWYHGPIEIDPAFVAGQLDRVKVGKISVIDIRSSAEYHEGHIPGAVSVPATYFLDQLVSGQLDLYRTPEGTVVTCNIGQRSAEAADQLARAGFPNSISMGGGMELWEQRGYPLVAANS
jgi:rhodanese-related sulfurtransferase